MIYKSYECFRSRLDRNVFYAYPANDETTCRGITASTADGLKKAIDAATEETYRANPWELPYTSATFTKAGPIAA